jgi:thioredoxin reductase (NADPH)
MKDRSRPVLLLVEPEEETRQLLERALRDRYQENEVISASARNEANDTLVSLKLRGAQVALMLVACDLQGDSGAEFLENACEFFPQSKRVMLADYDEKDSVLKTLTRLSLDNYLLKPLQSAVDDVYPLVDDLLKDWQAGAPASDEGVRIVGIRWSPRSHQIKKFLASNLVPYHWLEIEESEEARRLIDAAGADARRLPVIFFPDGTHLVQPEITAVAEKVGLRQRADSRFYDLIVVGGGPAGLSAAVYGASEGLSTLLIEAEAPGGQAGQSSRIENYLGFPSGLSGNELTRRAVAQAQRFGVEIFTPREATGIHLLGDYRQVEMADGSRVSCHMDLFEHAMNERMAHEWLLPRWRRACARAPG